MARGQGGAVPVRRGVAGAAIAGQHGAGGVIGRRVCRPGWPHPCRSSCRPVTSHAGRRGDGDVRRLGHVHRTEAACRIVRGVAGAAVVAGDEGCDPPVLPADCRGYCRSQRGRTSVALRATRGDTRMQHGNRGVCIVVARRRSRVAHGAVLRARDGHVTAGRVLGVVQTVVL